MHVYNSIGIYERLTQILYKNIRVRNKYFYAICKSYIIYYKLEIVYYVYSIHNCIWFYTCSYDKIIGSYNAKNNKSKLTNKLIRTKRNKNEKLLMREMWNMILFYTIVLKQMLLLFSARKYTLECILYSYDSSLRK